MQNYPKGRKVKPNLIQRKSGLKLPVHSLVPKPQSGVTTGRKLGIMAVRTAALPANAYKSIIKFVWIYEKFTRKIGNKIKVCGS